MLLASSLLLYAQTGPAQLGNSLLFIIIIRCMPPPKPDQMPSKPAIQARQVQPDERPSSQPVLYYVQPAILFYRFNSPYSLF